VALPDVGPHQSHVTRPGHKKEVSTSTSASWNSGSATSPKTGCAGRAAHCGDQAAPFPRHHLRSCHPELSLTTWKCSTSNPGP
jgi:hypothetical protein